MTTAADKMAQALFALVDRRFTFFKGAMLGADKKITQAEIVAAREALASYDAEKAGAQTPKTAPGLVAAATGVISARDTYGWSLEADAAIDALRSAVSSAQPPKVEAAPDHPTRRLSPFDAVAEAMRLASLMGGRIGMSDVNGTSIYEQRLRSHLVEFIYPAEAPQPAEQREPLTDEQINALFQWGSGQSFRDFARAVERAHGIGTQQAEGER